MKITKDTLGVCLTLFASMVWYGQSVKWWQQDGGVIKSPAMAKELATVYLRSTYGQKKFASELPLQVLETKTTWEVSGTLPPKMNGGTMFISLRKIDGSVESMSHGK